MSSISENFYNRKFIINIPPTIEAGSIVKILSTEIELYDLPYVETVRHRIKGPVFGMVIRINPERTFFEVLIGINQGWFNGSFERIIHIKNA